MPTSAPDEDAGDPDGTTPDDAGPGEDDAAPTDSGAPPPPPPPPPPKPDAGPGPGPSQQCTVNKDGAGFFKLTSAKSDYVVRLPASYNTANPQAKPLVVGLHGCGDNAYNFGTWAVVPFALRGTHDYIAISIGGRDGQCWNIGADGPTVQAAIDHVRSCFFVHQKKIFLAGYSSGGMLAYSYGLKNAARFAGILIENSGLSQAVGAGNVAGVLSSAAYKIKVAHTARLSDGNFPIAGVRTDKTALGNAGFSVTYRELAGGHDGNSDDWSQFLLPNVGSWVAP